MGKAWKKEVEEEEEEEQVVEETPIDKLTKEKKKKKKFESNKSTEEEEEVIVEEENNNNNNYNGDGKKRKKNNSKQEEKGNKKKFVEEEEQEQEELVSKKTNKKQKIEEEKTSTTFTPEEVKAFRKSNSITVTNEPELINPFRSFTDTTFPDDLLTVCKDFAKPTAIQSQCWPIISMGKDVVGISETGSGKTLAFLLPLLVNLPRQKPKQPSILVLAPTRELALQIQAVCEKFQTFGFKSICVFGGVSKDTQKKALRSGVHIVVATPGRLLDLIQEEALSLDNIKHFVLDEADRMLDMGFEPDIRAITGKLPKERQTLMFSATWPQEIQKMAREYQNNPIRVKIGDDEKELASNRSVKQIVEVIDPFEKEKRISQLLKEYHKDKKLKIIIFALYKKEAQRLETFLTRFGHQVACIHGDLPQIKRTEALQSFRSGQKSLLVATDVAARGLDIPDVEYVINYTFPLTIEDYVHRIGRTGRAGKTGISHTFFTHHDKSRSGELINLLKEAGEEVPDTMYKFGTATKKKEHALYGAHFKDGVDFAKKGSHVKFD